MTIAELTRLINSKKRQYKLQMQEKASFDFKLADLIGRSISRIYNKSNNMPDISEAYPALFASQEIEEQRKAKKEELSAVRFRQFAQSYNMRFKEAAKDS